MTQASLNRSVARATGESPMDANRLAILPNRSARRLAA
jgi:hypothetical protein